ncbi:MAG: molybdopterin converting factor subunit 1 [Oleiphilaceae bacterium]|nr:molybdopterin converting factor subunit 1 [Oleiphilaceae bacterium]
MKVLFFASLRERLGLAELEVPHDSHIQNARDLIEHLQHRGELWQELLQSDRLCIAINQQMALFDDAVSAQDEIAFFPPVTGG